MMFDSLTKTAHSIPIKIKSSLGTINRLYIDNIVYLHKLPLVSNIDPRFTSNFWKALHKALETYLDLSISHHPQTNGQSKRNF